jgi:3-phenylpropionate/trans-cinnamate dioxygenase ferredoxin reductase component
VSNNPIIIVGAGQAGLQVADSLRRGGYEHDLLLVGEEPYLPYQRPPLSKQYMAGEMADERLLFRPADYYETKNIEVIRDAKVTEISLSERCVVINGTRRNYQKLALTTGAAVRKLTVPGAQHRAVYYLRDISDATAIRVKLSTDSARVVAIGGGFIGLEIAAAARELGHSVTVIEAQDRLMARVVTPFVSNFYLELHRRHGVDVLLDTGVSRIDENSDGSVSVVLADGREVPADIVVVGVGSVPRSELAAACGISCGNGIIVDEFAQTSDPHVVAAGDCTMHKNIRIAAPHRLESVQNAVDQAKVAAATLLGERKPYDQIPWFWSDQFEAKLQIVGTSIGHDDVVLRGAPESGAFSCFYYQGDSLIGVDSVNRPADHLVSRKLITAGSLVAKHMVSDPDGNLKSLL